MLKRFQRFFTSLKEHGCVSYAKVATIGGFCDVDLILVKATAPDDFPLSERYVLELLQIFAISPCSTRVFALSFARRFGRTRCWRVALKCLLLVHRLLRSHPGNSPLRSELLWTRSNGYLSLYPCHFQDASSSASEDYTSFIRSYARLIDEALDVFSIDNNLIKDEDDQESPKSISDNMREVAKLLEILPQLQSLIDCVMDCRPFGSASRSFLVKSAMKHIIRDSFICYTTFRREIIVVLENLFEMPYRKCTSAFAIYKKASLQAYQLRDFYDWCKAKGLCGPYEYPFIDQIPQLQILALENFLNGMWQLTEPSSPITSPSSSLAQSRSHSTEDEGDKSMVPWTGAIVSTQWEMFEENALLINFEEDDEREPLTKFEESESSLIGWDWESILEASISLYPVSYPHIVRSCTNNNILGQYGCFSGHIDNTTEASGEKEREWNLQIYDPRKLNPFY